MHRSQSVRFSNFTFRTTSINKQRLIKSRFYICHVTIYCNAIYVILQCIMFILGQVSNIDIMKQLFLLWNIKEFKETSQNPPFLFLLKGPLWLSLSLFLYLKSRHAVNTWIIHCVPSLFWCFLKKYSLLCSAQQICNTFGKYKQISRPHLLCEEGSINRIMKIEQEANLVRIQYYW